jgi:hypothetical protein
MPNRPVTVRRWEVVGIFLLMVAIAAGTAWYTDRRVDDAYNRITRNTQRVAGAEADARIARAIAAAEQRRRRDLARVSKRNDDTLCGEIAAIKEQLVSTLISNRGQALRFVGRIPGYTRSDATLAEKRLNEAIRRFGPRPCPAPVLKRKGRR